MKRRHIKLIKKNMLTKITESYIDDENLSDLLYNTLISEKKRLKEEKKEREYRKDIKMIKSVQKDLVKEDQEIKIKALEKISKHYTKEIANVLNPIIYKISALLIPIPLIVILNEISLKEAIVNPLKFLSVKKNIIIKGEIETLKKLSKKGTVIIVPTHVSNLDSPVIGWSTYFLGLPPFLYGAGLDSFENIILNFFMTRIGAYSIDRKKHSLLYKKILKEYAIFTIEHGYENLFFPGGQRSRSGSIETKLKKGLLGTGLYAYINNMKNNNYTHKKKKDIYYIPLNLTYESVLEDETLINQYLNPKIKHNENKIIEFAKTIKFLYKMIKIDSKVVLNFGSPIDPFGNDVNNNGDSIDKYGNIIDKKNYLNQNDKSISLSNKNHKKHTENLSKTIIEKYNKNNTIMRVHFVSYIAYKIFRNENRNLKFENFIKNKNTYKIELETFHQEANKLLKELKNKYSNKQIDLTKELLSQTPQEILDYTLNYFKNFKNKNILNQKNTQLQTSNIKLLFYYHNHLTL